MLMIDQRNSLLAIIIILTFSVFISAEMKAAEIELLKKNDCKVMLKGRINKGDSAKLGLIFKQIKQKKIILCLTSKGGNYSEALKLVKVLIDSKSSVKTIVPANAVCLSSCALVFLAGHTKIIKNIEPNRAIHASALLGFHAPYIPAGIPAHEISHRILAFRGGLKTVASLLDFNHPNLFPIDLIARFLEKQSNEFFYIDRLSFARRYSINIFGFKIPSQLTEKMLEEACVNYVEISGQPYIAYEKIGKNKPIKFKRGMSSLSFSGMGDEGLYTCFVDIYKTKKNMYLDILFNDATEEAIKKMPPEDQLMRKVKASKSTFKIIGYPVWYMYPPDTKIKSLAIQ